MNQSKFLPDDPKLTAYALGELTGDERAAVEAALRENPALRAVVDEIRETSAALEAALAHEPIFRPVVADETEKVFPRFQERALNGVNGSGFTRKRARPNGRRVPGAIEDEYRAAKSRSKILRFPQFYYVAGMAAAACFAVMVALYEPPPPAAPQQTATARSIALSPADVARPIPTEANDPAVVAPEEPRIIAPAIAPATTHVVAETSSAPTTENARAVTVAASSPTFLDGNLSLMSQARREPIATNPAPAAEPLSLLAPSVSRERLLDRRDLVRSPRTFVSTEAPPPPVAAPIVASTSLPTVMPATAVGLSSVGSTVASTSGDVVVLSAFMVTADRLSGFAGASSGSVNATDRRKTARRDELPSPPPGARLAANAEAYSSVRDNDFLPVAVRGNQVSTLSVDVDTASYSNVRRILQHGTPPPRDAVRIEEMLNYFPYRYPAPKDDQPFAASLEVADAPWAPKHRLVRIGLKAREVPEAQRPAANLVFLLDVSGSMNQPNKLPLVQQSLRMLVGKLKPDDRVAIVTYAGQSGLVLPSTPAAQAREILSAIDALTPSGPNNGAAGIQLAYDIAKANFAAGGINRVILCTDGDFNVGMTSEAELVRVIEDKASSGVFLSVLGFGMGNYKDATLEKLADRGNGQYGYIDTKREAEKMLVEQVNSTLLTVAKDVKLLVEFNPATVASYRLIGYENRVLRKEDFNDDKVDAAEVGAGHTITVLYEIVPVGVESAAGSQTALRELKYSRAAMNSRSENLMGRGDAYGNELLTVFLRYKKPDSFISFPRTLEFPLRNADTRFEQASADFRFAAAVAQFGMILRGSPHRGVASMADVARWAANAFTPVDDPGGYRGEFVELVRKTQSMME